MNSRWDLKALALPHYIPPWLQSWQLQQLPLALHNVNTAALRGPDGAGTPSINRGKLPGSALRRVRGSAAAAAPPASAGLC